MNIFPVKFFRSLIEKKWQMLNKKKFNQNKYLFWQKVGRRRKKKLTERKDKTIHKDFDLKRAKIDSYKFSEKGEDMW